VDDLALLVFLGLAFVSAKTKCAKCAVGFQGDAQRFAALRSGGFLAQNFLTKP